MRAPLPFLKELELIDRKFSVIWIPKVQKYAIVTAQPRNVFRRGYAIEHLVEKDGKHAPLDNRVLRTLRRLLYQKEKLVSLDHYLTQLDREEEERLNKVTMRQQEMETDFMKKVHKFQHSKTFS